MKKQMSSNRVHDYLASTKDSFQLLSYNGTMIIVSLAILYLDDPQECFAAGGGSYKSAIYFFVVAAAIQLLIAFVIVTHRSESSIKEGFMKIASLAVAGIYAYLAAYFFLFSGCQQLIKYWVLGNVSIIIFFVFMRMSYILAKEGKEGLFEAITRKKMNQSISIEE